MNNTDVTRHKYFLQTLTRLKQKPSLNFNNKLTTRENTFRSFKEDLSCAVNNSFILSILA